MLLLGDIWTCDPKRPRATAVYIENETIKDLGWAEDIRSRYPAAKKYLFEKITPGVHDAHIHPLYWGQWLASLDLRDEKNPKIVAQRVAAAAATKKPGEWIRGGGFVFDHYPDSRLLDEAAPHNPVYLDARDLHSAWVNKLALKKAKINRLSHDPEGGKILRDKQGYPTGYLLERAASLVAGMLPVAQKQDLVRGLNDLAARGYVAAHAMGDMPPEATDWARELALNNELPLRLAWTLPKKIWSSYAAEKIGEQLHIYGVKYFADGALTSRTAWMVDEYPGGGFGMPLDDPREFDEEIAAILESGLKPVWHAIGSRAIRELLDLIERLESRGLPAKRNFRIEHVQHIEPSDLPRLAGLRLSMQPLHARDDAENIKKIFGATDETSYRWRDLINLPGTTVAFGSDAPVAEPDVSGGLAVATDHPLAPEQSLSAAQALCGYTLSGAEILGWGHEKKPWGKIVIGARAVLGFWRNQKLEGRMSKGKIEIN